MLKNRCVCPMCSSVILQHSRSGAIFVRPFCEKFAHEPYILFRTLPSRYKAWIVANATIMSPILQIRLRNSPLPQPISSTVLLQIL